MKSILSLIALAYLIQFSFSLPSVTVQEGGIIADFTKCDETKTKFSFSIEVKTEGFDKEYTFLMPLAEPILALAECTVGKKEESTRSTAETEYMDCVVDTLKFAIYQTKVTLLADYAGDGNFELSGWADVIGKNNLVVDYTSGDVDGCNIDAPVYFKPGEDLVDTCAEDGKHEISVKGVFQGTLPNPLSFMTWYSVGKNQYESSTCTLQAASAESQDAELKCTVKKEAKTLQFFETIPYEETAKQYVWIMTSKQFNLKDCGKPEPEPEPKPSFSAYIKLSGLLLLSLLF